MIDNLMVAIEDRKVTLIVYQSMQATEPVEQEVNRKTSLAGNRAV